MIPEFIDAVLIIFRKESNVNGVHVNVSCRFPIRKFPLRPQKPCRAGLLWPFKNLELLCDEPYFAEEASSFGYCTIQLLPSFSKRAMRPSSMPNSVQCNHSITRS